jgi:hypothetical protein
VKQASQPGIAGFPEELESLRQEKDEKYDGEKSNASKY